MNGKPAKWENIAPGVRVLKLWETDLNPDCPRIVILDLSAKQFSEFEKDVLAFDKKYELYSDPPKYPPIYWISNGAKPPVGKGLPEVAESSHWRVVLVHHIDSGAAYAACPHKLKKLE